MHSIAALEIHGGPDGTLPIGLLHMAYRASRRGRVALILKGVRPDRVDAAVDALVHRMRLDIPGLLYVDGHDPVAIHAVVRNAHAVFASHELSAAEDMLRRFARPTRLAEIDVVNLAPG